MLSHYQKQKEQEIDKVEKQDEDYIRSVFGKTTNNQTIKRIIDEDDEGDSETTKGTSKQLKLDKPTDILSNTASEKNKKDSWEKSIGSLNSTKGLKGILFKKKGDNAKNNKIQPTKTLSIDQSTTNTDQGSDQSIPHGYTTKRKGATNNTEATETKSNTLGPLGMIDYSDSYEDNIDN